MNTESDAYEPEILSFQELGYPAIESLESWIVDNVDGGSEIFFEEREDGSRVQSLDVHEELTFLQKSYSKMLDFIETVASGNTEIEDLERQAQKILDGLTKSES
jgi:hypothetical protein